ncbi:MAG: pseudouridine synthase [Clostridium sp.]|nr:MAG: pseudouridine synthase [Clostridium sp.]
MIIYIKRIKKVFVVHRLDKDTSGIVVFAKSERVKESLQNTWDYIERNYIAVVHGITKDKDTIKILSKKKQKHTFTLIVLMIKSGKYAETSYVRVKSNKQYSLLKNKYQNR